MCRHDVTVFRPDTPVEIKVIKGRDTRLYCGNGRYDEWILHHFKQKAVFPPTVHEYYKRRETIIVDNKEIILENDRGYAYDDLPEPMEDTLFITSNRVVKACPERDDLIYPNNFVTLENVKKAGKFYTVIGTLTFARN